MSAVVTLKKGEGRMVKSGGMWIFDNEIESVMGTFENGDLKQSICCWSRKSFKIKCFRANSLYIRKPCTIFFYEKVVK